MAQKDHFGDAAGRWNNINQELYRELGTKIPFEALTRIRQIRSKRGGRQGNTEVKAETKILLALRDGIDWRAAESMQIEHLLGQADHGTETAKNVKLRRGP